jgi:uncharacterized protein YjeT (DUF2065 family)
MHTPLSIHEKNMMPDQKLRLICLLGITGIIIIYTMMKCIEIYASQFNRMPLHILRLIGNQWVQELLDGHEEQFYNEMGMSNTVFTQLLELLVREAGLHNTQYVTAQEQLAIFLHYVCQGLGNWVLQEHFQRSGDTISNMQ